MIITKLKIDNTDKYSEIITNIIIADMPKRHTYNCGQSNNENYEKKKKIKTAITLKVCT